MPFPSNHACRLVDPLECKPGTFRSWDSKIKGKPVTNRGANRNDNGKFILQSVLYPTKYWSKEEASKHCQHKFEPASGK